MQRIEKLFTTGVLMAVIIVTGVTLWSFMSTDSDQKQHTYPVNKFGAFLASQHAVYVNDFESAMTFAKHLDDTDVPVVYNTIILSEFLNGRLPDNVGDLKDEKGSAAQLLYDAHLARSDDWASLYNRHKKDETALASPLRIWSGVATGKTKETLQFIDKLKTNDSWKTFVRGQIYAETDQIDKAAAEFAKVPVDFMNINDYLYIMAFYNHFGMTEAANKLHGDFTERPGGMYMLDLNIAPVWQDYSGLHNALAFSLIQNVSHTQIMMYSDLSLLMLRFAQVIQQGKTSEQNAINYYIGQYFYNNGGNYRQFFEAIDKTSPFYPFGMVKIADRTGQMNQLKQVAASNPLFVPATNKLVAKHIQQGHKRQALRVINKALDNKNLTETGRAFYLKTRAQIYLTFGDLTAAQSDIRAAADILPIDAGVLAIQSKIWAAENRELETAYEYAIALVRRAPTDIEAWDVLGTVVAVREGPEAALELIERVGQVSETCSILFEHLGDLYSELGDKNRARDAYHRAIELSDDGLTIIPNLEKKLRNIK